jgi:type VI secretion system secreted protein VgrG
MALNASLTPFPADLEVWEVRLSDGMNRPFELVVRGASTHAHVDLRTVLGHRITLSLPEEALLSSVSGIVKQASRGTPEASGVTMYELHIAPAEWVMTKRTGSRIFQKQAATAIVETVLREHPVTTKPAVFTRRLAEREYCVQYDESDSDFAHRLLAEEGIAAYFDQAAGGRWTLVDDTTLQKPPADGDLTVQANAANLKPGALAVVRWRAEQTVEPVAFARRDYDFQRPLLSLEHASAPFEAASAAEASLEVYNFEPDRLLRPGDDGQETARDLQAARALTEVVHLETNFAAAAGTSLHIEGEDLSGDWFVIGAEVHLRSSPGANGGIAMHRAASLTAIPLDVPYRPEQRKRPLIFGAQSARVVGASPEGTVDVDEHGRICLELRWDRRDLWARSAAGKENPTRRVRVAQAWAGPGYGIVTLPRVGDEVLVAYEDGNPDRPVVIGRLHNAVSRTPLRLPDEHKTLSIWKSQSFGPNGPVDGFNLIYMDDAAGGEMLGMQAQRDLGCLVARNSMTQVGADESTEISGNQVLKVAGSQTIRIGASKAVGGGSGGGSSATSSSGDQIVNVKGGYSLGAKTVSLAAKEELMLQSGTNMRLDCAADRTDTSGNHFIEATNIVLVQGGVVTLDASTIRLQSGSSAIEITGGGITITSDGPVEINGSPVKLNC